MRASITFLFGETDREDPLMTLAEAFYRQDPAERTDRVVTGQASLVDALAFLQGNPPANGEPWGIVNMVGHGNEAGVMEIPVLPGGKPITLPALAKAMGEGRLHPLPEGVLDGASEIRLIGCCVGRNPGLLRLLAKALGRVEGHRPAIRSGIRYTSFAATPERVIQFLADGWSLTLNAAEPVPGPAIVARLRAAFPQARLVWEDCLSRTQPRFAGDGYGYVKGGTFMWSARFAPGACLPRLESLAQIRGWLKGDPGFRSYTKSQGILWEPDSWRFTWGKGGDGWPTLVVQGSVRKLYVIKPIMEAPGAGEPRPLRPSWDDCNHYVTIR